VGVPQGGPISPTIFNIVMEGVEDAILQVKGAFPIRYADDIAVFANSLADLEKTKEIIANFLKPRGLELNEEKTKMNSIEEGVDLLGYNVREYPYKVEKTVKRMPTKKGVVIIKPGKKAVESFKKKLKTIYARFGQSKAIKLIKELNPVIRG
jgi:RNA-directed DNA polymerase